MSGWRAQTSTKPTRNAASPDSSCGPSGRVAVTASTRGRNVAANSASAAAMTACQIPAFEPKWWRTRPCATPAAPAISRVLTASIPRSAKSLRAAATRPARVRSASAAERRPAGRAAGGSGSGDITPTA